MLLLSRVCVGERKRERATLEWFVCLFRLLGSRPILLPAADRHSNCSQERENAPDGKALKRVTFLTPFLSHLHLRENALFAFSPFSALVYPSTQSYTCLDSDEIKGLRQQQQEFHVSQRENKSNQAKKAGNWFEEAEWKLCLL